LSRQGAKYAKIAKIAKIAKKNIFSVFVFFSVIPAKAGIQEACKNMDPGLIRTRVAS